MIVEERLTTYLHSLESADIPVLDEIEQEALADMVPIIRKETKSFLKVMLEIKRPVKILEIGTAVGFSAILMGILRRNVTLQQSKITKKGFQLPEPILPGQVWNRKLRCLKVMHWRL